MFNFLSLKTEAFGLNINDSSIKVVQLKKKREFYDLVFSNKFPINPGIVENGEIKEEEFLVKAIKEVLHFAKGPKTDMRYAVASLPEEKSFLQVIQMPIMTSNELKSAIIFEAENYIPLPIDQVYLDFRVINPLEDQLNHLDVLIVAMPKTIVDSYALCLKKAGLIPVAFEVESEAIARALVKNQTSSSPLFLVDIGEDNTCFAAFAGHSIRFTSSIPFSFKQLKIATRRVQKFPITFNELSGQIEKYLSFYQDHAAHEHFPQNSGPAKIILSGEGADSKELLNFLSKELKVTVELGDPRLVIQPQNFWDNFKNPLHFTTAFGLAIRGTNNFDQNHD